MPRVQALRVPGGGRKAPADDPVGSRMHQFTFTPEQAEALVACVETGARGLSEITCRELSDLLRLVAGLDPLRSGTDLTFVVPEHALPGLVQAFEAGWATVDFDDPLFDVGAEVSDKLGSARPAITP